MKFEKDIFFSSYEVQMKMRIYDQKEHLIVGVLDANRAHNCDALSDREIMTELLPLSIY